MGIAIAVTLLGARVAKAQDCLPPAPPASDDGGSSRSLRLGLVGGAPVACLIDGETVTACWDVDAATGALHKRAAAPLPGASMSAKLVKGCANGYCNPALATKDPGETSALFAISTDGAHVAIVGVGDGDTPVVIFDAKTKKYVRTIALGVEGAPQNTNVTNSVGDLAYVGNTVYVLGQDAGPFAAVWAYKDDGTRLGVVTEKAKPRSQDDRDEPLNVESGGLSVLDDQHVGVSTDSMVRLAIIGAADGSRVDRNRKVSRGPCKRSDLDDPAAEPKPKCMRHIQKYYAPYVGASLVSLPGDRFLAALRNEELLVLDGKKLAEKKRLKLPLCAR